MTKSLLRIALGFAVVGMLEACVSGTQPTESYVDREGITVRLESNQEMCLRSCNDSYARCMDSRAASGTDINGRSRLYGASAECYDSLKACLASCKQP
ncbi:MAG: hypothetical protein PHS57_08500 [Alphaproteobacteria bacterium]|nr:hypothetical protein [Alphaproteobacteria bacterium]